MSEKRPLEPIKFGCTWNRAGFEPFARVVSLKKGFLTNAPFLMMMRGRRRKLLILREKMRNSLWLMR